MTTYIDKSISECSSDLTMIFGVSIALGKNCSHLSYLKDAFSCFVGCWYDCAVTSMKILLYKEIKWLVLVEACFSLRLMWITWAHTKTHTRLISSSITVPWSRPYKSFVVGSLTLKYGCKSKCEYGELTHGMEWKQTHIVANSTLVCIVLVNKLTMYSWGSEVNNGIHFLVTKLTAASGNSEQSPL